MQGEREMGREREGGREELLLPNYSDWAGSALFTNRTRFSNPGSPNLTSKHRGAPDWETGRERERERSPKRNNNTQKNFVSLFWPVFTLPPLLPPQTPPPLPHRPVASFGLYVVFFGFFFLEERHSQEEGELLLPHSRCSFFVLSFFFPLLLLRR